MSANSHQASSRRGRGKGRGKRSSTGAGGNTTPKPKRPMTAYNFFFQEERKKILSEGVQLVNPGRKRKMEDDSDDTGMKKKRAKVSFEDLARIIGQRWKEIDAESLARYTKLASGESKRYKVEMKKFYEDEVAAICLGYNNSAPVKPSGLDYGLATSTPEQTTAGTDQAGTHERISHTYSQNQQHSVDLPPPEAPKPGCNQSNEHIRVLPTQDMANKLLLQYLAAQQQQQQQQNLLALSQHLHSIQPFPCIQQISAINHVPEKPAVHKAFPDLKSSSLMGNNSDLTVNGMHLPLLLQPMANTHAQKGLAGALALQLLQGRSPSAVSSLPQTMAAVNQLSSSTNPISLQGLPMGTGGLCRLR